MQATAETTGVRVTVVPTFVAERSDPGKGVYFWAYTIEIANLGQEAVTLLTRRWIITDGHGRTEEIRGAGVVGEQPMIAPGESYRYTSGCPLSTPEGSMQGSYGMVDPRGNAFDVAIPHFILTSPFVQRTLH